MGAAASHQRLLTGHTELLDALVGSTPCPVNHPFWQELLSFPVPLTKLSPEELEAAALPFCDKLVQNNSATRNFQTLLSQLFLKLQHVTTPAGALQATNTVVFVRIFAKHLTETLNAADLVAFLNAAPPVASDAAHANGAAAASSWVERLPDTLVDIVIKLPVRDDTYLLHLELLHLLLVMTSTQLYTPSSAAEPGAHPFTDAIMRRAEQAPPLLYRMLQHYIERRPLPPRAPVYVPASTEQRGVLRMVRSAAASVLWLPLQALTFLVRSGNQRLAESPLCETGLLLLLALVHHAPVEGSNPFQAALQNLQNSDREKDGVAGQGASSSGRLPGVEYPALYEALGKNLTNERSVLLLYDLLHTSPHFRNYIFVRSDCEVVMLPLLRMLYSAVGRTPSQMYMLLIIILILSQDAAFSQAIHKVALPAVPWYHERMLKDTSLGSLLIVLLLRTAHYNLSKLKDVYLHTNTLAALANLAPHMSGLSSHAAQRLVSLFDMLSRRYSRLTRWQEEGADGTVHPQEQQVYFDFLRIVLEIINCVLVRGLTRNPELVYALLHRQDVFTPFKAHTRFSELLENIQIVITFFNERIDEAKSNGEFEWSVSNVLEIVKANLAKWRPDRLRQFPELRFTYEEEASPEGFFVPYVWTLIVTHTTVPWRAKAIALFSPIASSGDDASLTLEVAPDAEMAHLATLESGTSAASDAV